MGVGASAGGTGILSDLFLAIKVEVKALQNAHRAPLPSRRQKVKTARHALLDRCLELEVKALSLAASGKPWQDDTTAAAAGFIRMVELARRHESPTPNDARSHAAWLLTAAALFYRAGRHGSAASLLRNLNLDWVSKQPRDADRLLADVVATWLGSGLPAGSEKAAHTKSLVRDSLRLEKDLQPEASTIPALLAAVELAQGVIALESTLRERRGDEGWSEVRACLARAESLARAGATAEFSLLIAVIARSLNLLQQHSIWNLLPQWWTTPPAYAVEWAQRRVAKGKGFLFPGQRDALIGQNLLSANPALASMPTGAGKSLLAEVAAMRTLANNPDALVLVVVPTKALANEKRDELAEGLAWDASGVRVLQLTGEITIDDEDLVRSQNVVVLTPEKVDAMLRNGVFDERKPTLLVVDEFHQIRRGARGFRLQATMKRLQQRFSDLQILLISAIVRPLDFKALAAWVGSPAPFESAWRPTPVRAGIVDVTNDGDLQVEFNDGTTRDVPALGKARTNATTTRRRWVSHEFAKDDQVLQFETSWRVPFKDSENRLINEASAFAKEGFELPAYCSQSRNKELLARYARLAGPEDPLVRAFSKGIAVHWGDLPVQARRIVEEGIRSKAVGLVLTTSTLAEGVNLPVRTVFVPSLGSTNRPLEKGLYLNVMGRAGRPYQHAEGQVILGYETHGKLKAVRTKEAADEYRETNRDQVEPIRSSLAELGEEIAHAIAEGLWESDSLFIKPVWEATYPTQSMDHKFARNRINQLLVELEAFSSVCLALLIEHRFADFFSPSFRAIARIGTETDSDDVSIELAMRIIRGRLLAFGVVTEGKDALTVTDWGKVVYRIGLGPESCVLLRKYLHQLVRDSETLSQRPNKALDPETMALSEPLVQALWVPIEFEEPFWKTKRVEVYLYRGWVAGHLLADSAKTTPFEPTPYIEALTRVASRLSGQGAWVFTALAEICLLESRDELAKFFLAWREASFYGTWRPDLLRLLKTESGREVLRDDLLLVDRMFKGLTNGRRPVAEVEGLLKPLLSFGLRGELKPLVDLLSRPES